MISFGAPDGDAKIATMRRRVLLGAGLAAGIAGVAGCGPGSSPPASLPPPTNGTAPATRRPAPDPATTLTAAAAPAPYAAELVATLERFLAPTRDNPKHPGFAGGVVLAAVDGRITVHEAIGDAVRYQAGPRELPAAQRVAMRPDSVFDTASLTKVTTAILTLQLVDDGLVDLDAPVARYLPEFGGPGKAGITVAQVLAHTSGLSVGVNLAGLNRSAQNARVLAAPLLKGATPGTVFRYSGTGLMVLGLLVERLVGQPLDIVLRERLAAPLSLTDTGYLPLGWLNKDDRATRLVATDARRRLIRGEVHDDTARALGGVAGHAGLFSTAADLAVIGQMLLAGGTYGGTRVLTEETVIRMLTNANPGLPAVDAERPHRTATHGLGVELNQTWFMGRLASATTFGHTGFTGTELVVDPIRRLVLVLLTNRAHPNWTWADPDVPRVAAANVLAAAIPTA